jgi:flavin reductase (DIM6/NTAB) family NADH-FMN oxidoreductase RutF
MNDQPFKETNSLKTKKVEVDSEMAYRLLHPRHTVLVSCRDKTSKANIITLAWIMPTSINPPMLVISISPKRYSHRIIEETGEFVVNVPTMKLAKQSVFCGRISGAKVDKFKKTKLTALPAKKVKSPIIKECVAHLECKLTQKITTGDHTLFVGDVVAAYVNKGVFTETYDATKVKPLFHIGGDSFVTISPEVVTPPRPRKIDN